MQKVQDITGLMRETEARVTPEERRSWMYRNWCYMMRRCYRDKGHQGHSPNKEYKKAGVIVCDEWKDYISFRKWALENGYDEEKIRRENRGERMCPGRIGDKGNFEPGNVEWITLDEEIRRWLHPEKRSKWSKWWTRAWSGIDIWDVVWTLTDVVLVATLIFIMLTLTLFSAAIIRVFLGG